jgi:hypothetical protein
MKRSDAKAAPLWQDSPLVEEGEIFADLGVKKGSSLLLGRYSLNEVIAVLAKKGFLREARKRFLWPLAFELNSTEYPLQRLQVFFREKKAENLIVDFKFKEIDFVPKAVPGLPPPLPPQKALAFEWLTLQNPLHRFSESFTPLPGQTQPGLNMGKPIMDLFVYIGRLTRKDCLLAFPAYFHNALLFSRYFRFWNPRKEGEVLVIRKSFSHTPLKQLAWIVHLNCLRRADGSTYEWTAEEQLHPLTRPLKDHFASRAYREAVKAGQKGLEFSVDWAAFEKRSAEIPSFCGGTWNLL